ncbi:MAG: DNA-protecting protein DprA [Candidatus Eremiobacteraeota bacterium]|nr:DNA-protecting protein DprA [Candidatus Eremiobacteraeota bacterium]
MDLARPSFALCADLFANRRERTPKTRFEGLWAAGSLAGLAGKTVAVVGSRAPSDGGRAQARALGEALARAGVCVVSGLALGIDASAHEGSLAGGGPPLGVLGGGHRRFVPRRNRELAAAMLAAGGAVLSPFAPDEPARPPQFLQRNAVVAALADAVVVVEAAARSGALNTASWAADLGIEVLAYPGDVDRPKAAGCNALIRDGAILARGPDDVLEAIGLAPAGNAERRLRPAQLAAYTPVERRILNRLAEGPNDFDTVALEANASPGEVAAALVTLEIGGAIRRDATGARYALA